MTIKEAIDAAEKYLEFLESAKGQAKIYIPTTEALQKEISWNRLALAALRAVSCERCEGTTMATDPETNCGYECPDCKDDRAKIKEANYE